MKHEMQVKVENMDMTPANREATLSVGALIGARVPSASVSYGDETNAIALTFDGSDIGALLMAMNEAAEKLDYFPVICRHVQTD